MQVGGFSLAVGLLGRGSLLIKAQGAGGGPVCCPGCALSLAGAPGRHWSCFPIGMAPGAGLEEFCVGACSSWRSRIQAGNGGKIKLKSSRGRGKKGFLSLLRLDDGTL